VTRRKKINLLILTGRSFTGGGQRWVELLVKNLPNWIEPRVIFTGAGHPGRIFHHRLQPWLAPFHLQYNKYHKDWPKQIAEYIDQEAIHVLIEEEDERLREIIMNCKAPPKVVYVKHTIGGREDIAANRDIIDQVVCVSEKAAENIGECIVIRNGVEKPDKCPLNVRAILGIPPDAFVVGYIGRVDRNKNVNLLVDIAHQRKWLLLIVGEQIFVPSAPIREIESNQIICLPSDVYYVANWYEAMDVFVLPSFSEGFPLAPLEALLCGTRVAMTPTSDFPQLFDGAAIKAIENAPPAKKGQGIVQKHFTAKRMVADYVALFSSLLRD